MNRTICLDWGSTNLRAYLLEDATLVDRRECAKGVRVLNGPPDFEAVFDDIVDGWREGADRAILSGMVTSVSGWCETPYLSVPTRLDSLLNKATRRTHNGLPLFFLPGLSQENPADVIRGEEIQLLGLADNEGHSLVVLPGTHSKWVTLHNGNAVAFRTYMTGELFDILLHHSLVGRIAVGSAVCDASFARGVHASEDENLLGGLFRARAKVLLGQSEAGDIRSYLSGLLIGTEIRAAIREMGARQTSISIAGTAAICMSYERALRQLGILVNSGSQEFARLGFERLAVLSVAQAR